MPIKWHDAPTFEGDATQRADISKRMTAWVVPWKQGAYWTAKVRVFGVAEIEPSPPRRFSTAKAAKAWVRMVTRTALLPPAREFPEGRDA